MFFKKLHALNLQTSYGSGRPTEEIALLKDSGLLEVVLPGKPYDFNGRHSPALLSLLRRFGRASGAIGRIYEGHINALFLIHLYGTETQKRHWYGLVREERALFGVWNTDAQEGLRYQQGTGAAIMLEGAKAFCSGADLVDHALMGGKWQQNGKEAWQMAIVPMADVGEERIDKSSWQTLGMRSSISYTICFSGISIPESKLLGAPEDYTRSPFFLSGAIRFAAVHQGMAESVFQATLHYLQKQHRADDVFQKVRIGHMQMAIRTGQLWLSDAAKLFDKTCDDAQKYGDGMEAYAHMARLAIERIGLYVLEQSAVCVGAKGLMANEGIESLHRDLAFYLRQPAPDATLQHAASFAVRTGPEIVDTFDSLLSER